MIHSFVQRAPSRPRSHPGAPGNNNNNKNTNNNTGRNEKPSRTGRTEPNRTV